jgi:hypothetical protein
MGDSPWMVNLSSERRPVLEALDRLPDAAFNLALAAARGAVDVARHSPLCEVLDLDIRAASDSCDTFVREADQALEPLIGHRS